MRLQKLTTGMAALVGLWVFTAEARAQGHVGCSTCGPAHHVASTLHAWHAKAEIKKGCAGCNPHDPYYCGSTGVNGSNGYCNQRFQHMRRLGVLMNKNQFMGDSWYQRYNGGYNFTPSNSNARPAIGSPPAF